MASVKPKKGHKMGSSRRYKNRNRDMEEKLNDDGFPDPGNEEHNSEQSQFHTVSENKASNESSLHHSEQPVAACTNPNTSVVKLSPLPQTEDSKDLLGQAEVTKKRKMGSTRKGNRNLKTEEEPEHRVQLSESVIEEQEVAVEASIKEDESKEDQTSLSDCAPMQSSEHQSYIQQGKHLALVEDDAKNDEHQHLEAALQSKPMESSSSEINQSIEVGFGQDLICTSLDFSIVTSTECNVPLHELDESLQTRHHLDTSSEPVACIPKNTTGQKSRTDTTYTPLKGNRDERPHVQMPLNNLIHNDKPFLAENTVLNTMDDQSSLNFNNTDKPKEHKQEREDVNTLEGCTAEDIGQDEVTGEQLASLENENEHGTQDDTAENRADHCLDHKDDTVKLTKESIYESKRTEFREDVDEYKEVSVVGDRTDNDSDGVIATNLNHAMEPDRNIISPLNLKNHDVGASSDQFLLYDQFQGDNEFKSNREEQYDLSEARCWTGESSADKDIGKKELDMCNNEEEKCRAIGTEKAVKNDDMQSTTSNQLLFPKVSLSTNLLDVVTESELIPAETLHGKRETSSQSGNLHHNNPGEFPTKLEILLQEGVCFNQKDRSEFLDIETGVIEKENNSIKEEINAGSTKSFTKEDFIKVDDEKDVMSTFMNEHDMLSVITTVQDYAVTEAVSMGVEECGLESPVHANNTSGPVQLIPERQVRLDMEVDNAIAVKPMKEAIWVQSLEESASISEDGTLKLTSETCFLQSSESLNIREPEAERIDENTINAVLKNENINSSQEYNETPQHISTEFVSTIQECGMLVRQDEETARVKNICGGVDTTHVVLSDVLEHLVDNGVLKMQSRTYVDESIAQNELKTENIHVVESNQSQNILEEHVQIPPNRESEAEQLEITNPIVQILDTKSSQVDEIKETLEFSSSEKRRKMGSTRKSLRGKIHGSDQKNKIEETIEKEMIQEQSMVLRGTITGDIVEDNNDAKVEINAGPEENFKEEDITTISPQQYMHCDLSFQTTDRALPTTEHQSAAQEHPDLKEDDGNIVETVEKTNAEIHMEIPTKKKKKFASTRRPHGRHQPQAEGEEGEWKVSENTEEIEHQITTQADTSNLLSEPKSPMSEVTLDIHDSTVTTEQNQMIKSEVEVGTGEIDAPPAILSAEVDQIPTVVSDVVSNAEGLTDITEPNENPEVNEEKDAETIISNEQEMAPIITKIQDDAFIEHVSLKVKRNDTESPDHESASEVDAHSICSPVELTPETQAMSDMEMKTENILAVEFDQSQKMLEEHLQIPPNRESEAEQLQSTSPFVQIQETKSSQVDVSKDTLEFSSSEKRRKMGSTRKSLRGKIHGSDQKNKIEETIEKEMIQEQSMVLRGTITGDIVEDNNDAKVEINAGPEENFKEEDITTISPQQYMHCDLSFQTTDLALTTTEHQSSGQEHPDLKEDDGNIVESVEKTNAEIHMETPTKKKKKFASTRKPHGRHQTQAEGEEGEWKVSENTEEIEHQITTQADTSNLLSEPQSSMSEVTLDIHDSTVTTEENQMIKSEVEVGTGEINAPPAILSAEVDQIHTVASDVVSNAEGLTDITEPNENPEVNEEKDAETIISNEQELAPIITNIQDDAFIEHVSLTVKRNDTESPDHESASEVDAHSICSPVELTPETQAMSDMEMKTENILAVESDQSQKMLEEHLQIPPNRESEAEQLESTSPIVQIQETKSSQVDVINETLEFSSFEKRRKMGSTRKNRRGQIKESDQEKKIEETNEKEMIQGQNMDLNGANTGDILEEKNDTKEEINAGPTENFTDDDITTISPQQYMHCDLSFQTTDLALTTTEHQSSGQEHPDLKEDDGNTVESVEKTNAAIHTQTPTKKKKKFASTQRLHGRHQPQAEGEEGEWKVSENTEEIEHQITTQADTSNLFSEPQSSMSEVTLDIHDSTVKTEQNQMIKSEVEVGTGESDAPPAILSAEVDQIHTVASDVVSNAEGLTDITESNENPEVNEENDAETIIPNEQEMAPIITKIQDDAFIEHVSLRVKRNDTESPDHESASEVDAHSICSPVEPTPETQAMSDMEMKTENILAVEFDQSQKMLEEHLQIPPNRESEPEQLERTSPFVQIQETKSSQVDVINETLEFSSSEKRRKMGSTRKNRRGQIQGSDQTNKIEETNEKEMTQEQGIEQKDTNTGDIMEEYNDTKEEINAGPTQNFSEEDIRTVCPQQYMHCDLSSQTTDLTLTTTEHQSSGQEHPHLKEDDGNIVETVEKTNAEIHMETPTKKKKKFASTRKPHGRHQTQAEGEEGEWKVSENTEEIEHQITTQADTSNLLSEPKSSMSEVTLDIHDSTVTTEQNQMIKSEVEVGTGEIDAPPAILSAEVDQIPTVVSDVVSNAEGLTDITEPNENPEVNEEKDAETIISNEQEMAPIITKIQDDAFKEHVSLTVKRNDTESPDHESAGEVDAHSICSPVELTPETQAMSDMEMKTENILAVEFDQSQKMLEEHLQIPPNRESEAEQLESTTPFVQIQETKSSQVDVINETLEFSSSEKRRKMGSTRKNRRGQIQESDQENKIEETNEKEMIQGQNMDLNGANTGDILEEKNDTKEEINAGPTENFTDDDITTISPQQYMHCDLSFQTTDLALTTTEHQSSGQEHPDLKEDDGNTVESVEKTNAAIHTQTPTKKKKKFTSTRRLHGRHQPQAEGEEGEWKVSENTEEIEHQITTQADTSNLFSEPQSSMSEVTLDIHDSTVTTEQNQMIKSEVEVGTGEIDAPPAILSAEVDQIHTVASDVVSNAEGLTDITESNENPEVNEEKDAETIISNEQELAPIITKIKDDAFKEHVSLTVKRNDTESPDHESASEVDAHSICSPVELTPETQAMSDMEMKTENILAVEFDQSQKMLEEHLPIPPNRESEPEQLESTTPFVQIQETKSSQADVTKDTLEFSSSEKRRKMGSTRKNRRGQIQGSEQANKIEETNEKEMTQEQCMDQKGTITGDIMEDNNDTKVEINAGPEENFKKEDITTVCPQQYMHCDLSFPTTDQALTTTEHQSAGQEHPDLKEDDGNIVETVEKMNAEIHMEIPTKKKKKFASTRRPHGRHQTQAEGEEGEWKVSENTEETEHQITTQAETTNLLTEPQSSMSEVTLDIHDSTVKTEQNQMIKSEVEVGTGEVDAPPAILSAEVDQIHTVASDVVSNAEGLTDITESNENPGVNEEKDAETMHLDEQEMAPIITKIQDDAFIEHVSLRVKRNATESPDHESASQVDAHSICSPVELTPETQAMSDMEMKREIFCAVKSDQCENILEEHLQVLPNRESEAEQLESTSPFVQIQETKSSQVDVIKETLEFSSSEKRRKMGSTRKNRRGQIQGNDQTNKIEETIEKEMIQGQNMDLNGTNTGDILEEKNDTKEEINAGPTENFTDDDITTISPQQYMHCDLSSQTTDLALPTTEHQSSGQEHPHLKEDDGNIVESVEKTNAEIHMETPTKKKKKFASTRRPHRRDQPQAEGEEGEWKVSENTEEIEHQITTQADTSNLLSEPKSPMSEVTLDIHDSTVTTEQNQMIKSEVEVGTGEIDAPPAILSAEVDQIPTVVSDVVSNAEGLTDITEPNENPEVNEEKDAETIISNKQEMAPIITKIKDDAFKEHVSLTVKRNDTESPDHESASEVDAHSICSPVELTPETQAMSDMEMKTENILAVEFDQSQKMLEEHLQIPPNRESEAEQLESTSTFVQIQETKSSQVDVLKETLEFSSSEKRRKMGSTRKNRRGQIQGSDQTNKIEESNEKEMIQGQKIYLNGTNPVDIMEENNYTKEEINAGTTETFTEEHITTICPQQYVHCDLSFQNTDLALPTTEHQSSGQEHSDLKEDDGNIMETVEKTNAEIHMEIPTKKKRKFASTRRLHGRHQPQAEGEEGEWKVSENTEETEHQITTQAETTNLLTEPQSSMSEVTLDIHDSTVKTEQNQMIKSEVEVGTGESDAPPAILSAEVDQIHTVVSDVVSNAEGLTDITEPNENPEVNEEKDAQTIISNEQEMAPIITNIQDDAFIEHVSLTVKRNDTESPDHESASEVDAHSICSPVELTPETQAMSDMEMKTENILAVEFDQSQKMLEEHLQIPPNRESEPEQLESTTPFVEIQETKSSQVDVIKETLEFSSSEKRRKMGSTRKNRRGQIQGSDQTNKIKETNEKEMIQGQNMDLNGTNTGDILEEKNDTKEEINAGPTENFTDDDITTICPQLCELSSQSTDLALTTPEHLSPIQEHPDLKEDDGNIVETVEKTNAAIHTQTSTKKKKKFASTRRLHGRHQPQAEGEEGEWKVSENTEEIEHQITTQADTSNLLSGPKSSMSEVTLDIHDSTVKTEQNQMIKSEVEVGTGESDAPPAILSAEVDQIHTVVSDVVSNAEGLTDITEPNENPEVNEEKDAEIMHLDEQEMAPIITKIQDDNFTEHVSLIAKRNDNESPDHESASQVDVHSICSPVDLIPETQAMLGIQMKTENIHEAESDQWQNILEEHLHIPPNRESDQELLESTSPIVQIQETKSSQVDVIKETLEFSSSEKRRKMGSTRKNRRGQIKESDQESKIEEVNEKEMIQGQSMDLRGTISGDTLEENNDTKEEINAGPTETYTEEHITTVCPQLCELSSQTTDLTLTTPEHPDFKEDHGNIMETVEKTNAEIHMQTPIKKKKKFGSTRRPHGRLHAEGEKEEWTDVNDTEESELKEQAASSNLLLDTLQPSLRTEQGVACIENESTNQLSYPSHVPMELIPERQAKLYMPVLSEQYHMLPEEPPENPKNRESEPEHGENRCPAVHIQELKFALEDTATQNSGESNSGKRKKMGSTRKSLRVIKEKEYAQEERTEESTPTAEMDHSLNVTTEISHQSMQIHSKPLNFIAPEAEKLGSICEKLEDEQGKQEAWQKTKHTDPRCAGNSDGEYLKLVGTEDMLNPDSNLSDTVQEYETQIQSQGSLLSEIELYLSKSLESTQSDTVLNPNISEFSEPMSDGSLQLSSSQNPPIHMEQNSPTRRRKMGSSRKQSRKQHTENISSESRGSEQENENLDKNDLKNSEPERDAKTVKETVISEGTEDMKESVELMSEVQTLSQINESGTQATGQPLPEGRRKFGSRRTAEGGPGLGAFKHGDYESKQKKTDVTKDELRVSDPNFISEPESAPISHPVSEPRPGTEEVRKTVEKDTNASTEAGHVSLDNIRKTSPCVVSTGGRQKIDFEQWNEQIPDFGQAIYNVVMVGNSNVGKTSFIKRLQSGCFIPDYSATIGVDTFVQTVTFGNRTVKLYVWDTAGQERYHSITRQVFHKAQGLLLMYDITSSQSFHAVRAWITQVQENAPPDVTLMLLGNKNDCAHREVQLQEGEDLAKEYNIHFMECSAATGENLSESLKTLAWLLVKQRVRKEEEHTTLQPKPQNKKSGCC